MSVGLKEGSFYYDEQLKKYIMQFMAIFTGLQVKFGKSNTNEEQLVEVPVFYGDQDRVVAAIMANNTQNRPIRLPCMSAKLKNMGLALDEMAGIGNVRRTTYVPSGGLVPDDVKVVRQLKPMPYKLDLELAIYVSNTDQLFQILEQVLVMFKPTLQIQRSDDVLDWTALSTVTLADIMFEQNYAPGTDRRIIQASLQFSTTAQLSVPADIRSDFVERVFARIGVVNSSTTNSYDIIQELDDQGAEYEQIWCLDTTKFQ